MMLNCQVTAATVSTHVSPFRQAQRAVSNGSLRLLFPAVITSPQSVTSIVEDVARSTHTIAIPYFASTACWQLPLHTEGSTAPFLELGKHSCNPCNPDLFAGFANKSAAFHAILASSASINLFALRTAREIRDDHTSDGRPCTLWESRMGTNAALNLSVTYGFCLSKITVEAEDMQLVRSYQFRNINGARHEFTNMTVEYNHPIIHDVDEVDRTLDLHGAYCANISVRAGRTVDEDVAHSLGDGSVPADEAHPHQIFSLTTDAAASDGGFRRLAQVGVGTIKLPTARRHAPTTASLSVKEEEVARWMMLVPKKQVPLHFDARDAWPKCGSIRSIRDQGGKCGSCWAHGAVESLADRTCIQNSASKSSNLSLSVQYILDCDTGDSACMGGYIDLVWEFLKGQGSPRDACVPYTANQQACNKQCVDGTDITNQTKTFAANAYPVSPHRVGDIVAMQRELVTFGPFETIFWVFSDFGKYRNGTYVKSESATNYILGGHAVKIVGYGVDENQVPYWTVANSYGTDWGLDGFFRIRRGTNECGIETVPTAGLPLGTHTTVNM